jgi:hypothetical protein
MTFELQKDLDAAFSGFAQDSLQAHKKKERPDRTLFQKLCSAGDSCLPGLKSDGTKSHVRSPSVVVEARNSAHGVKKTSNSDAQVVAQPVQNLCRCRKTCA